MRSVQCITDALQSILSNSTLGSCFGRDKREEYTETGQSPGNGDAATSLPGGYLQDQWLFASKGIANRRQEAPVH